jgi:DNA-binding CsgD family transcriptional regulator
LEQWKLPKPFSSIRPRPESSSGPDLRASAALKWASAGAAFLVADASGRVVCANAAARRLLFYPAAPRRRDDDSRMFARRISRLVARSPHGAPQAVWSTQITSGRRRYRCRAIPVALEGHRYTVLLIERTASRLSVLSHSFDEYHFTPREKQTVELLAKGLTNKQIAARMGVSVNTVKAFIRSAMLKVGVRTRTAIIGRLTQVD